MGWPSARRYRVRMSDELQSKAQEPAQNAPVDGSQRRPDRQGPPPTPFDHPLFLPALLAAGMVWFGYDGWLNPDPDMAEHRDFNRYGFGALTLAAAWFGWKGWREWQEDKAERASNAAGTGVERPPPSA